jgi:hypothetical protein
MEDRYKEYYIVAEAERDPANNRFRALIFIETFYSSIRYRHPARGRFFIEREAELQGLASGMDWIDKRTAQSRRRRDSRDDAGN